MGTGTLFYTYAFQGIILSWIEDDMKQNPEEIIQMLFTMTQEEIISISMPMGMPSHVYSSTIPMEISGKIQFWKF